MWPAPDFRAASPSPTPAEDTDPNSEQGFDSLQLDEEKRGAATGLFLMPLSKTILRRGYWPVMIIFFSIREKKWRLMRIDWDRLKSRLIGI
jgi:hypothetical protein